MSIAVTSGTNFTNGIKITSAFDPTQIFVNNEQGYWLDSNDFNTMFQDPAGTTPVTSVGQSVRLMLDKSRGLVPGPGLVSNTGPFTATTGYASFQGTLSTSGGSLVSVATVANDTRTATQVATEIGKWYRVTAIVTSAAAGTVSIATNFTSGGLIFSRINVGSSASSGTITLVVLATNVTMNIVLQNTGLAIGQSFSISSVTANELPGNHFAQSNVSNAPILGREPITGRRNLLTFTEEFDNAVWLNTAVTVSGDTITDNATLSSHDISQSWGGPQVGFPATVSVEMKAGTNSFGYLVLTDGGNRWATAVVNLLTGQITQQGNSSLTTFLSSSITALPDDWYRVSVSALNPISGGLSNIRIGIAPAATGNVFSAGGRIIYTGTGTTIRARNAQAELGSTATNYQRVGTSFDVTESGIQTVHYLAFDGTDDWLQSAATINPGNIDKVQVFAGVRKLSDTNGTIVEGSSNGSSVNGSFALIVADVGRYSFLSRGTVASFSTPPTNSFVVPITNVLTGLGDISGDSTILRVNGTQAASGTTDQGTGNYLTYTHYIGRRGSAIFPLNGRIYQLITRYGPNLTTQQIQTVENYVTNNTLFTIGSLFTNNTGALLESFDQSTLFQDDIGTQPVTATGQAVGLWLDKSRGLGFGTELIINGDFSQGSTQWNTTANVSITNNQAVFMNAVIGNAVAQVVPAGFVPSRSYQITYTITSITSGSVSSGVGNNLGAIRNSPGTYTDLISSPTNNFFIQAHTDNTNAVIDNVSVRELYGNHAIQSNSAQRPLYQTTPTRLTLDRVDDRLVMNVPTGGFVGTMVLATPEGTAAYGVNIPAGSYNIGARGGAGGQFFPGTAMQGYIIRNVAMSQGEIDQAITYLRNNGGGSNYGTVTDFTSYWRGRSEIVSFPVIDTSAGTNFSSAWQDCTLLTSFPLINTAAGTNFVAAWQNCILLTSFPLINTAAGTNFVAAWRGCMSLTDFPLINTAAGTNFTGAWNNCYSLTSFPLINTTAGTSFAFAWLSCTSLATFPANFFNGCAATNFTSAFTSTNLSQTSIDNILVSINSNGTSNGTFNQSGGSAPSATGQAAITAMRSRGWTVTVTGGF